MSKDRPNVLLITIECWRGDHLGEHTPEIVEFAKEATRFRCAATAGGWTRVAMTALMSSAYASMYGGQEFASPERKSIAECFLQRGYWTAGFTANLVCGTAAGFHRGFGTFAELRRKPDLDQAILNERDNPERLIEVGVPPSELDSFAPAQRVTERAIQWVNARGRQAPFFLWLHYLDPHFPCLTGTRSSTPEEIRLEWMDRRVFNTQIFPARGRFDPGPELSSRYRHRYCRALSNTDSQVGKLLDVLRGRPDWDHTIVCITGDHGEEFQEHGTWHHSWNQLHEEGIKVPLIMKIPETLPAEYPYPVGHIDVAPTILDFSGIEQPGAMIGRSLRGELSSTVASDRIVATEMFGHRNSHQYKLALRKAQWKYIYDFENPHGGCLFDLCSDPSEQRNLREDCPEVFRQFERARLEHVSLGLIRPSEPVGMPATPEDIFDRRQKVPQNSILEEHLAALGYL